MRRDPGNLLASVTIRKKASADPVIAKGEEVAALIEMRPADEHDHEKDLHEKPDMKAHRDVELRVEIAGKAIFPQCGVRFFSAEGIRRDLRRLIEDHAVGNHPLLWVCAGRRR